MGEKIRLDKLLSNMGKGSRSEMKDALRYGYIKVNGETLRTGKEKVDPEVDEILYKGAPVIYKKHIYLMLNKPQGVISATGDKRHKTVVDLVDEAYAHYEVFPVGRLDIDTEGLLILTNDGELTHELLAPKKHVPKVYHAVVDGVVGQADIEIFAAGITLEDGYVCKPSDLVVQSVVEGVSEVLLTIHEGKFHQVKRMFEAVDKPVTYLKRVKMNALELDPDLALGEMRELTETDFEALTRGVYELKA